MIYTFNISVITDRILNNDDKSEVMEAIKANIGRIKKTGGHLLHDSEIQVTREVSLEDIGEAIGVPIPTINYPQTRENCYHFDEAQGRHKCINPILRTTRCMGVCASYKDKRIYLKK